MRRIAAVVVLVMVASRPGRAQFVVHDSAVTLRNSVTATIKEYLLATQREQHERLRRMAGRLSELTDLRKYAPPDPPEWRPATPNGLPITQALNLAMYSGDPGGIAYLQAVQSVASAQPALRNLPWSAQRAMTSALATVDLADATIIAAIDGVGQLRATGRAYEERAVDALETDVVDASSTQSATAVLDKVAGAVLIGARQRQARIRLLAHVAEQLLVDSKRTRDTEATSVNMQLVTWRDAGEANRALVEGTGDALRAWRQP